VILYRDDWVEQVGVRRAKTEAREAGSNSKTSHQLELVTSVAEVYRENQEFSLLAMHYDRIGNKELRDKYIDVLLLTAAEPMHLTLKA